MRIAHFGTFDVENYGDLLFPLIVERRLRERGDEIVHVSPVGGHPVFGDCVLTISSREAFEREFDAVIVGGGHIVHAQASDVVPYAGKGETQLFAYSDLWFGASRHACELGVPLVWNAPGVPGSFSPEVERLAAWAVEAADRVAVRDERSRSFLVEAGAREEVTVAPDSAIEVDRLFSHVELDRAVDEAFASRGCERSERTITFHFNSRYLTETLEETAARIDSLCRREDAKAVLLALGCCHGDGELAAQLGRAMTTAPLVVETPRSLREVIGLIRDSECYIGSSLHGAITATAFERPALIVAREAPGGHAKFSGFIASQRGLRREEGLVESWTQVFERIEKGLPAEVPSGEARASVRAALDEHWVRVGEVLDTPSETTRASKAVALDALAGIERERWQRAHRNIAVLLDQAAAASGFRETAQKNARRFRELDRHYRALKQANSASA